MVADVLDELFDFGVLRVDVGALINAGQKTGLPVLRFLDRITAGTHGDEAGQILVLGAQAVRDPRADAGPALHGIAAIHQHQGRLVIGQLGLHRADDRDVVDALADLRKQLADFDAALAVFLKLERRRKRRAGLSLGANIFDGQRFAGVFGQRGFGIERIDMRRPAVEEKVNHPFGFGRKLRRFGRERVNRLFPGRGKKKKIRFAEGGGKKPRAHDPPAATQKIPPRQKRIFKAWLVMKH